MVLAFLSRTHYRYRYCPLMIRPKKGFSNLNITNRLTASGLMHTKKSPQINASIP
jgi:hypothetical protein